MDYYGIGSSLRAGAQIYCQAARQSGRTTAMVESLRDGARVVFATPEEKTRVTRLCRERGVSIVGIVADPRRPDQIVDNLHHGGVGLTFDHSWVEQFYILALENAGQELERLAEIGRNSTKVAEEPVWIMPGRSPWK